MLCRPYIRGHAGYREKIKLKSNSSVPSPQGKRKRLLRDRGKSKGRVGNWRSGLGLAYPHFHEDVSVSVPFV